MNKNAKLKVPVGTLKVPVGTVTLQLFSWLLVVLVLTAGILLIPKVNAVEAAVTESTEVDGYTWYYTVETINNVKVATNVYLKDVELYDNLEIPNTLGGFPVYSLGEPVGTNKDSFLQGESSIWCVTIDATKCTSLKVINSNVCANRSTFIFKLPDSVERFQYNAFVPANNCGIECNNPNIIFENSNQSAFESLKLFMPNPSNADEIFGTDVCVQASTKVYGKTYHEYTGPNTCKINFSAGTKGETGSGLFNAYVYAVSDADASKELQQATYCNIPKSDLYDFDGYYFGSVPETKEQMQTQSPIFDKNGVFHYDAFLEQCNPQAKGEVVLVAKWIPKTFEAVLVCEGDESKSSKIKYTYGETIHLPKDCPFTILGQTVEKWSCNGIEYEPNDKVPSTIFGSNPPKFYPVTRPNTYSIRYLIGESKDDANVIPEEHTFSNTEKFNLKKNVYEKTGYRFMGWTTQNPILVPASEIKVMYYDEQEVPCLGGFQKDKEVVDLYAVWERRSVDVSYVDETGAEVETQHVEYAGEDVGIHKDVYDKNGYDVDYYTDQNGKVYTEDGFINALDYDQHSKVILAPTFKKTRYKVVIENAEYSTCVADDFKVPEYKGYTQEGYRFAGWDCKAPLLKKGNEYIIPQFTQKKDSVLQLSPIWEKETYGIYYDTVVSDDAPRKYQIGDKVTLPTLCREGYKFLGWNNGSMVITELSGIGDVSLVAEWEELRYSLYCPQQPAVLNINGVRVFSPDKESYDFSYCKKINTIGVESNVNGKMMTGFTVTDKQGHVLYTYSCEPTKTLECTIPKDVVLDPSKTDMTLNLVYSNEKYTITYDTNGGILPEDAPEFYLSGSSMQLPKPSKENYIFSGWYDDNANQITEISSTTMGNLHLKATYERKKCSVTLNYDGGVSDEALDSISYIYEGGNVDLPKAPEREGHTFVGWYDEVLKRFVKTVDTSISEDRIIRAVWTRNSASGIEKIVVNPKTFVDMEYSHSAFPNKEGYYYSQLSDAAKKLYTEVYYYFSQKENFYTETSLRFSVNDKTSEGELELAMMALLSERPELFWVKAFDLSEISDGKICVTPRLAYNNVDAYADRDEFDANINELLSIGGNTPEEKIRNLITEFRNRKFKIFANGADTVNKLKSAAHLCVFKEGTSESLAKLVRIVCRAWDIPCIVCYGETSCWNLIEVNGEWYYINAANEDAFKDLKLESSAFYTNASVGLTLPSAKELAPILPPTTPAPAGSTEGKGGTDIVSTAPPTTTPKDHSNKQTTKLRAKIGGVTYEFKVQKKGLAITKVTTKKSTITVPSTAKVKGKKYKILQINQNAFKGCKKVKTIKLRAKFTFAKGSLNGLNKKLTVFVSKKYFKPMKKVITSKKTGWKKTMKLKRG